MNESFRISQKLLNTYGFDDCKSLGYLVRGEHGYAVSDAGRTEFEKLTAQPRRTYVDSLGATIDVDAKPRAEGWEE